MGWVFTHRDRGSSTRDFLAQDLGRGVEIVASACHFNVAYLAIATERGVMGAVVLTRWAPTEYHNFGVKWMDESVGPGMDGCPERILDLLDPVERLFPGDLSAQRYASGWRDRCVAAANRRAHAAGVRRGDVVSFDEPLRFGRGWVAQRFVFERGSVFHIEGDPAARVRITNWRQRTDWTREGDSAGARSAALAAVAA